MTTNKPEVVSWGIFYRGVMQDFGYNEEATKAAAELDFHGHTLSIEPLIRLSDYQRLQAECEKLRKDAERYRWLRVNCEMTADEYGTAGQLYFGTYQAGRLDEAIDVAIDAAMQDSKE